MLAAHCADWLAVVSLCCAVLGGVRRGRGGAAVHLICIIFLFFGVRGVQGTPVFWYGVCSVCAWRVWMVHWDFAACVVGGHPLGRFLHRGVCQFFFSILCLT